MAKDIVEMLLGEYTDPITFADLFNLYVGGMSGFGIDALARAYDRVFNPGGKSAFWVDLIGFLASTAGAIYLKPPYNTLLAGTGTGFAIGAYGPRLATSAQQLVASRTPPHPSIQVQTPSGVYMIPPRGTGLQTGTAKYPTGPAGRLTEAERYVRHNQLVH